MFMILNTTQGLHMYDILGNLRGGGGGGGPKPKLPLS